MKPKNTVINTVEEARRNPAATLFRMAYGGGVEGIEADGQRELVRSEVLPRECGAKGREALEAAGVVFGEPIEGDLLFVRATLPTGWKKQSTDHAMWSDLLDERGRKRASIFYKAAPYDRRANMHVVTRFSAVPEYSRDDNEEKYCRGVAKDGDTVIFTTRWYSRDEIYNSPSTIETERQEACRWLDQNRPDWTDPKKYWDE